MHHAAAERGFGIGSTLQKTWSDGGYRGKFVERVKEDLDIEIEVVSRPGQGENVWHKQGDPVPQVTKGFQVVQWRWLVERTFGWIGRNRRLSKDYEGLLQTAEAFIWAAALRMLVARLAEPAEEAEQAA